MSVDRRISIATVKSELDKCQEYCKRYSWDISEINETDLKFTVLMVSPIDEELFIIEILFDNYPQMPPLIEFLDPQTGARGVKNAYPKNRDSFFHSMPCICNPCSRKSYKAFSHSAPHGDWQFNGWKTNPKVGNLKSLNWILATIYTRISNKQHYEGRMK